MTDHTWAEGTLHPRVDLDDLLRDLIRQADRRCVLVRIAPPVRARDRPYDGPIHLSLRHHGQRLEATGRLVDALMTALATCEHRDRIAEMQRASGHVERRAKWCRCEACT